MEGGYDCEFVEPPPDELVCLICTFVAREPYQQECCGRVFCKTCLEKLNREPCLGPNKCPNCRQAGRSFIDQRGKRNIQGLKVKCKNDESGCQWVGELGSLDDHHDRCGFELVACPNQCMQDTEGMLEDVCVLRQDLDRHLLDECPNRQYECPHCEESGKYCEMSTAHLKVCPFIEVACPNSCGTSIVRRELSQHRSTCPDETVLCKYAEIGCETTIARKCLEAHEKDDQLHLHLALNTVVKLKTEVTALQTQVNSLNTNGIFRVPHIKMKWVSSSFYSHPGGYKMCIEVYPNGNNKGEGTHISVFSCILRGDNDDNLVWPFRGSVKIELLNQLEDKNHYSYVLEYDVDTVERCCKRVSADSWSGPGWGVPEFIRHTKLGYNELNNCQYVRDNFVFFRVSVKVNDSNKPWLMFTDKTPH